MSVAEWPCFARYPLQNIRRLAFERAIWGKVHGAASDYRWIARSPGFKGQPGLESTLSTGLEDAPCAAPFWYCRGEYCYAVWCYPSRASDAAGRSGFVEKQILEWRPSDANAPSALGAMALLPQAATYGDSEWLDYAGSGSWSDRDYVLPLKQGSCQVAHADLAAAVDTGLKELQSLDEDALARFYASLITAVRSAGENPAILSVDNSLSPLALGAILLPLPERIKTQGVFSKRVSLAGGVASRVLGEASASAWHGVACRQEQMPRLPVRTPEDTDADWAAMIARAVRQASPTLARPPHVSAILEFARGPRRWIEIEEVRADEKRLDDAEVRLVENAVQRIRAEAMADAGLPDDQRGLPDARTRQLGKKADIVLAAAMLTDPNRWPVPEPGAIEILEQWQKEKKAPDSLRKLLKRIQAPGPMGSTPSSTP